MSADKRPSLRQRLGKQEELQLRAFGSCFLLQRVNPLVLPNAPNQRNAPLSGRHESNRCRGFAAFGCWADWLASSVLCSLLLVQIVLRRHVPLDQIILRED